MCNPFDPEMAYQMECCGDLDTPVGVAHRIAREIQSAAIQTEYTFNIDSYTPDEVEEILKELERLL